MKRLTPILLTILLAGCLESNPQPSPGTKDDGVRTGGFDVTLSEDDVIMLPSLDAFDGSPDVVVGCDTGELQDAAADASLPMDVVDAFDAEEVSDIFETWDVMDIPDLFETWDVMDIYDVPDAPEDALPPEESAITGGGSSFGMCSGPCKTDLTLDGAVAHAVTSGWDDTIFTDTTGALTAVGLEESKILAEALVEMNLQAVYGCPDCADGGASYIALIRDGVASSHAFEFSNPPPEFEDANAFVFQVISDLLTCTASVLVTPDPGCVPAG